MLINCQSRRVKNNGLFLENRLVPYARVPRALGVAIRGRSLHIHQHADRVHT